MPADPSSTPFDPNFPLLTQSSIQILGCVSKPSAVSAASLLASSKAAKSSTSPYKTLSPPIDRIISPFLRPGYGMQISGPPGTYVEQLVIGLVKSVTSAGNGVVVVDMQNKLKADAIDHALDGDERAERVHYHTLHTLSEAVVFLMTLPKLLSEHPKVSLVVLSSLSFPFQAETHFPTKNALLDRVRELVVKLCKQHELLIVITSSLSMHFVNPDGSRGTFDNDSKAVMNPQIDLFCKSISSLIISRDNRKSGRAVLIPATNQAKLHVEFDFVVSHLPDDLFPHSKPAFRSLAAIFHARASNLETK